MADATNRLSPNSLCYKPITPLQVLFSLNWASLFVHSNSYEYKEAWTHLCTFHLGHILNFLISQFSNIYSEVISDLTKKKYKKYTKQFPHILHKVSSVQWSKSINQNWCNLISWLRAFTQTSTTVPLMPFLGLSANIYLSQSFTILKLSLIFHYSYTFFTLLPKYFVVYCSIWVVWSFKITSVCVCARVLTRT